MLPDLANPAWATSYRPLYCPPLQGIACGLGSASRRLRGAGSFAHLRVDNAGYGDSSDITALLIERSRETSTSSLPRPSARPRIIATARAFMKLLERTELPQGTRLYKLRSSEEESLGKGI